MISVQRFRREMGMKAEDEDRMLSLRLAVISLWTSETGRDWALKPYTRDFRITRPYTDKTLILPTYPVAVLTSVQERYAPQNGMPAYSLDSTFTTVDAAEYMLDATTGMLERISGIWQGLVRVAWTAGYAEDTIDAAVVEALIVQARFMLSRNSDSKLIVDSETFAKGGGTSSFMQADYHPLFKAVAKKWTRFG